MLAVVTGASRGIGRASALLLAERGCRLALISRPSPELDTLLAELGTRGASVQSWPCDVADAGALDKTAQELLESAGVPDAVIHNAGVIHRASVEATRVEDFDEQLHVNLRAPFVLTRALLPAMLARRSGRMVYVGSISATVGTARAAAYCASKWGLLGFTKSLAEELSGSGLSAVTVLPGSVDTGMLSGSGFAPRMSPEDVAKTLVYFALDAPLAHNGATIEMFGI